MSQPVLDFIYESIIQEYPTDPLAISVYCEKPLVVDGHDQNYPIQVSQVVDLYLEQCNQSTDPLIWQRYITFLKSIDVVELQEYKSLTLQACYEEAQQQNILTVDMILDWYEITKNVKKLKLGMKLFPKECRIQLAWIKVNPNTTQQRFESFLNQNQYLIWKEFIQYKQSLNQSIREHVSKAISIFKNTVHEIEFVCLFISFFEDDTSLFEFYQTKRMEKHAPMEFFQSCIQKSIQLQSIHTIKMYEYVVYLYPTVGMVMIM